MKMFAQKTLIIFVIGLAVLILSANFVLAAELSKKDATKILEFMGYKNPQVAAVINGIGILPFLGEGNSFGSPNAALVIGVAERGKKPFVFREYFFFDKDAGWFYFEIDNEKNRVRMWTLKGYMEVKLSK